MTVNQIEKRKVIISRKGFDSSAGGISSPILDKTFFPLPIPEGGSDLFYKDLKLMKTGLDLLDVIRQLGARQYSECHMDPNLNPALYGLNPSEGWSPAFGQDDIALSHLIDAHQVKKGDIFLFFGRFRHAQLNGQVIKFTDKDEFHAIYGFMEIGEVFKIGSSTEREEFKQYRNHPHVKNPSFYQPNSTLFIPAVKSLNNFKHTFGTFHYDEQLVLTEKGKSLSEWKLPNAFFGKEFSYNMKIDAEGKVNSPRRGQEFIGVADDKLIEWIREMIENSTLAFN